MNKHDLEAEPPHHTKLTFLQIVKQILLLDDHPMIRDGVRHLLANAGDCEICAEVATAAEALQAIASTPPDLVIMDLSLPDRNGLEILKDLQAMHEDVPVLVFSMHDEMLYAERVLRAGGRGYLMKGSSPEDILEASRRVLKGSIYVSDQVGRHILNHLGNPNKNSAHHSSLEHLSDRELEIFELLGRGYSNSEIGDQLLISPRTVDAHRTNIKSKLGLPDSVAVMRHAVIWVETAGSPSQNTSPESG